MDLFTTASISVILFGVVLVIIRRWPPASTRHPPGPPPVPFFGNVLQLDAEHQFKTFHRWGKRYGAYTLHIVVGIMLLMQLVGDLVFVRLFQKPVVILNSLRAAQDLLEKKGAIYSDRPHMTLHVD